MKHRIKRTEPDNQPLSDWTDQEVLDGIEENLTGSSTWAKLKRASELIAERGRRRLPVETDPATQEVLDWWRQNRDKYVI